MRRICLILGIAVLCLTLAAGGAETPEGGRTAVLRFSSFDGGGYEYSAIPDDPEIAAVSSERDYGGPREEPEDGSPCDWVFTFTGLKPGSTRVWIVGESPIMPPTVRRYALTLDEELNVTTEELSVLDRFEWTRGGEYPAVTLCLFRVGTEYLLWPGEGVCVRVDASVADAVREMIERHGLMSWDGFDEDDPDVLDGSDFTLRIAWADGTGVTAQGSNAFPPGYDAALTEALAILEPEAGAPVLPIAGVYRYEGEGFGGDFVITLKADGTFTWSVGPLSSYLGYGIWSTDGPEIVLCEAEDGWSYHVFIPTGDGLIFDREASDGFPDVYVPEHGRFLRTEANTETEEIIVIQGSLGNIYGELKVPESEGRVPLIILSHGFGGNHTFNADYCAYFNSQGFATYNYDFCGGGMNSLSGGTMLEMSVLTEAEDLNAVIDHFQQDPRFSAIYLWGASQGGFVSSYVAAHRPQDVAKLMVEFPAIVLQDDAKARANPDGSFPATSSIMGVTISRKYNEDAVSFDLYDLLPSYTGPVLILHGDRDPIVPLRYSERAAEAFPNAELVVMPGQGHGFMGPARREAMEREAAFFMK